MRCLSKLTRYAVNKADRASLHGSHLAQCDAAVRPRSSENSARARYVSENAHEALFSAGGPIFVGVAEAVSVKHGSRAVRASEVVMALQANLTEGDARHCTARRD